MRAGLSALRLWSEGAGNVRARVPQLSDPSKEEEGHAHTTARMHLLHLPM